MATALVDTLTRLHALILEERECAKRLDTDGLTRCAEEKGRLLALVPAEAPLAPELKGLAEAIRRENRRNAYLFWSGLGWVREIMGFFNQQAATPGYGRQGGALRYGAGGRLLNGKV